jgi:hypothetical protein
MSLPFEVRYQMRGGKMLTSSCKRTSSDMRALILQLVDLTKLDAIEPDA